LNTADNHVSRQHNGDGPAREETDDRDLCGDGGGQLQSGDGHVHTSVRIELPDRHDYRQLLCNRCIEQHGWLQLHSHCETEVTGVRSRRLCITTGSQPALVFNQEVSRSGFLLLREKERETMKNPFSPRNIVSIIAVAMITLVTLTNFAHAEGPSKGAERKSHLRERVRTDMMVPQSSGKNDQVQYSQDELEQTRTALLEPAGAVKDLTDLAPGSFDTSQLEDATKQVSELS